VTVSDIEFQLRSADATWCFEKWECLPDDGNRYEVIDGVLYMSTSPSHWHQHVSSRLTLHVGAPLEASRVARFFYAPIGLLMPGCDPVQPDFLLIRLEQRSIIAADGRIRGVPDLIAEILSPSNPEHDLRTKRGAYARAGVPEYWILRPETRDVFVLSRPDVAAAEFVSEHLFSDGDDLVSPTLPIRVPVAVLFDLTSDAE
jgi:Uma2 family endonuclease